MKGDGWFTRKLLRISKVLSDWFGSGPASHWASEPGLFSNPRWSMRFHILPPSLSASLAALFPSKFLGSHISSSILNLFFCLRFANFAFSSLYDTNCVFSLCTAFFNTPETYTEHNLIRAIKNTETTNQATLLHRQARKQIKLADLLTLYFPFLFRLHEYLISFLFMLLVSISRTAISTAWVSLNTKYS